MTSGSYMNPETFRTQATSHQAPNKLGQRAKDPRWNEHPGHVRDKTSARAQHPGSGRSSSRSNAT